MEGLMQGYGTWYWAAMLVVAVLTWVFAFQAALGGTPAIRNAGMARLAVVAVAGLAVWYLWAMEHGSPLLAALGGLW